MSTTLVNHSSITSVRLSPGGYALNTGTITGNYGIYILGGAGTVINSGRILGESGQGVELAAGGTITNQSGGSITGHKHHSGIYVTGGSGNVVNAGRILGSAYGVALNAGGSITNESSGFIAGDKAGVCVSGGVGQVINAGTVEYGGNGRYVDAIDLKAGGSITNESSGFIRGSLYGHGVSVSGGTGYVVNAGTMAYEGGGVYLGSGGSVTNKNGGFIQGDYVGVSLARGGSITNQSGGTIYSYYNAINVGGSGTVTNSGTITGDHYAIRFYTSQGTLIVNQGAVFKGLVNGDGSTLIFGEATTSSAVITGLGTALYGFDTVEIAAGHTWNLPAKSSLTLGPAVNLVMAGTLAVNAGRTLGVSGSATVKGALLGSGQMRLAGLSLAGGRLGSPTSSIEVGTAGGAAKDTTTVDAGALVAGYGTLAGRAVVDNGTIAASCGDLVVNTVLSGAGTADITSGATLSLETTVSGVSIDFGLGNSGDTLAVPLAAGIKSVLHDFGAGDVVDLTGVAAVISLAFNTTTGHLVVKYGPTVASKLLFGTDSGLTQLNFASMSDGHGGTDIMYVAHT